MPTEKSVSDVHFLNTFPIKHVVFSRVKKVMVNGKEGSLIQVQIFKEVCHPLYSSHLCKQATINKGFGPDSSVVEMPIFRCNISRMVKGTLATMIIKSILSKSTLGPRFNGIVSIAYSH